MEPASESQHFDFAHIFRDDDLRLTVANSGLEKPVLTLQANMNRVRSLGAFPYKLAAFATLRENKRVIACHNVGVEPKMYGEDDTRENDVAEEMKKLLGEWSKMPLKRRKGILMESGVNLVNLIIKLGGEEIQEAIQATLATMITASCTAFEVVAEDCYTAIYSINPSIPESKSKRVGFRSRGRIRNSFKDNISDSVINSALSNQAFDAIFLIRNALVHVAGMADKDFVDGVLTTPLLDNFKTLSQGSKIRLDGACVKLILDEYVSATVDFVESVDRWITANKP